MAKIGRNDLCPCGSGKKFKKCCIDKYETARAGVSDTNFNSSMLNYVQSREEGSTNTISELIQYNRFDLLSAISYLKVLPENHGKNIRLEEIQCLILSSNNQHGDERINASDLELFFDKHFLHNHQEDPPENLFTENIMTPIGNKIIFPGLAQGQIYFLQQLINVISMGDFERYFIRSCLSPVFVLLSISDYIAKALKYDWNMKGVDTSSNNIYVANDVSEKKNIFRIPSQFMQELIASCKGDISDINLFLIEPHNENWDSNNPDENPIIHKPILFDSENDEYIVISPVNLLYAALNCLLRKTIEYGKLDDILKVYSYSCWHHCDFILYNMGFRKLDYSFQETNLPIYEGLYIFDTDKLAYLIFFYDDGASFNVDKPLEYIDTTDLDMKIISHIKKIHANFKSDKKIANNKFFNVNVSVGIGRPKATRCPNNLDWNVIGMSIFELEILSKSGKCNNLTLWNYSNAVKSITLATPFFLDNIAYFIENDESFYATDEPVDWLMIAVGSSLNFRVEAVQKFDIRLFKTINGEYIPFLRESLPALLPIYTTKLLSRSFLAATPSLGATIFVRPRCTFIEAENEKERFESEICIAILYWIFVLSDELKKYLPALLFPIDIEINLDDISDDYLDVFDSINKETNLFDKICIRVSGHKINIGLDRYFLYHLVPDNNYAEKILIQKILHAICDMYWNGVGHDYEVVDNIIKDNMPLSSQKKIIFKISDYDIRVIPRNIIPLRLSSPYALNKELDHLGEILTEKPYKPKDRLSTDYKRQLVNKVVVHFYDKLRFLIKDYSGKDVVRKLLALHEAAVQKREAYNLEIIPKIECFKDYTDIHTHVAKQSKKNTEISLALRCLIEHIVAEPMRGAKSLDIATLDTCVAYMIHIINWGFVSDSLNFNLTDTEISLLKSGRIGTDKSFDENVLSRYALTKVNENIFYRKKYLSNTFSFPKINVKVDEKYEETDFDRAFHSEFNMSYDDCVGITHLAIGMAFEEEDSVAVIKEEEFIFHLEDKYSIDKNTIMTYIANFSLFSRGKVQNVKVHGFKNEDFYPWRYNRKLSLLSRPLIVIQEDEIGYLTFGARALIDFLMNFTSLISHGRFHAKSMEMKSFLSQTNNENGADFTNEVYSFLKMKFKGKNIKVKKEVTIKPNGILKNGEDIGDIDVLIIDNDNKRIISIECKYLNEPRTPYEMYLELMKFIDGDTPWIPKVDRRKTWIHENKRAFSIFEIPNIEEYDFEYVFLTNESISIPFIKKNDIQYRFITFVDLQDNLSLL